MNLEFRRTGKRPIGKLGIYAALMLCITAIGIGSYAAMKTAVKSPEPTSAIDWDNYGFTLSADKNETQITVEQGTSTSIFSSQPQSSAEAQAHENLPFTGSFTLPLGTQILKDYSDGEMVSSKTMGDWRIHNGIDFSGSPNAEVISIQSGTVADIYTDDMWGLVLVVDHGNGMLAKYCGLAANSTPKEGAKIRNGETIGKLGEIPVEAADEPHLHLEITVDGKTVDPLAAMNRADH